MATRSVIAIKKENGEIESVYCHSDGYPSHNGSLLLKFYSSEELAKKVISLGGISFLDKKISPEKEFDLPRRTWRGTENVKHSFDTPQDGVTVFYCRDRGEGLDISKNESEQDFINQWNSDVDYLYLWKDEKWFLDGIELTEEMTIE